jgi:putative PIN family toxin of toxin-antitoxin system
VLSDGLMDEILINLRNKIKLPSDLISSIELLLRDHSHFSKPIPLPSDSCRDSDDIKILGLALASNADYIVTGDKDLLVLNNFQNIPVISPRTFYDMLHKS